jgi:hypothetical protein
MCIGYSPVYTASDGYVIRPAYQGLGKTGFPLIRRRRFLPRKKVFLLRKKISLRRRKVFLVREKGF